MESTEHYTIEEIWDMDAGMWTGDDDHLRLAIARALSKVPVEVVDFLHENCLFFMPTEREKGEYIPNSDIQDKDLILFPEAILASEEADATILHEAAHCYLRHKSPWDLSIEEYDEQERQANKIARQWLENEFLATFQKC